jgi:aldose 1-epimerase
MEVYSDQPGVQFYTANFLPDPSSGNKLTAGKKGAYYMKQGAFCLETQNFPDAVNHVSISVCVTTNANDNHYVQFYYPFFITGTVIETFH